MPFYEYKCKNCGRSLEILRQFSEFDLPPVAEEVTEDPSLPACSGHDWERQIGGNQTLTRGPNWTGRKGYW